jgi:hypothetical protein
MNKHKIARAALEEIVNPIKALSVRAEKQGLVLSHMSYEICNSASYLQEIARKALEDIDRVHE